jgi:hypothetical protein
MVLSAPSISSAPALPPTVCCQSFLESPRDVLSTPPSALVSSQHAIGFLPVIVILIVCFPCFFFSCFSCFCLYLLVFPLLFSCMFYSVCSFYLVVFPFCTSISLYVFSFMFLLVIRLYPLILFSAHEYICIWYRPLGCGCERYFGFWVEEDEYWLEGSLLSRPRNKC